MKKTANKKNRLGHDYKSGCPKKCPQDHSQMPCLHEDVDGEVCGLTERSHKTL